MVLALFKLRWIAIIVAVGITFFAMLVNIMDASVICARTNECKPLADATVGQFLGSQTLIMKDIEYIKANPEEDSSLIATHKERMWRSVFLSLFMIYLVWWVLDKILLGIGQSEATKNVALHFIALFLALIIIYLSNVLYLGYFYGQWNFMPFGGFFDTENGLLFNFNVVFESVGVYRDPFLNETIEAINNTIANTMEGVTVV